MKKGERDFKRWEGLVRRWDRRSKVPEDMGKKWNQDQRLKRPYYHLRQKQGSKNG